MLLPISLLCYFIFFSSEIHNVEFWVENEFSLTNSSDSIYELNVIRMSVKRQFMSVLECPSLILSINYREYLVSELTHTHTKRMQIEAKRTSNEDTTIVIPVTLIQFVYDVDITILSTVFARALHMR